MKGCQQEPILAAKTKNQKRRRETLIPSHLQHICGVSHQHPHRACRQRRCNLDWDGGVRCILVQQARIEGLDWLIPTGGSSAWPPCLITLRLALY